jgi:phosphoribosylglycinamide formyltransferase-1
MEKNKNITEQFNVVVLASGGGGNFQALIDKQDDYGYKIKLLIVDRDCNAINRANQNNIPFLLIDKRKSGDSFYKDIEKSIPADTNLIVLAGFLSIISEDICEIWKNKIINTHPSLLPKYGGRGMIGLKVHEAVMKAKEIKTGCTVHYVDKTIDGGKVILQESLDIHYNETPWQLGGRVHKLENVLLPKAVKILMAKFKTNLI